MWKVAITLLNSTFKAAIKKLDTAKVAFKEAYQKAEGTVAVLSSYRTRVANLGKKNNAAYESYAAK